MLDWLTESNWTRGATARDSERLEISCTSTDAEYFDLFGALYISKNWSSVDAFYVKVNEVKNIYKLIQPAKYNECVDEDGKVKLSSLNDALDNFGQVKQILTMLEI